MDGGIGRQAADKVQSGHLHSESRVETKLSHTGFNIISSTDHSRPLTKYAAGHSS